MNLFDQKNWGELLKVIINLYKDRKFPLNYSNNYQLLLVVLLSAQDSDAHINRIAPAFFKKFPHFQSILQLTKEELISYFSEVKHIEKKSEWIMEIANQLHTHKDIPLSMKELIKLKGIGRKSANAILSKNNIKPKGILVDLHVIRVSIRLGITEKSKYGDLIETQLMQQLPIKIWNEVGIALSFLGREICHSQLPKCLFCPLQESCNSYHRTKYDLTRKSN